MNRFRLAIFMAAILLLTCSGPGYSGPETTDRSTPGQKISWPETCIFPGLNLPPETEVQAVGDRSGKPLGWNIDHDQDRNPTLIKVAVNSPQAPVALILGAYEANVWQIGWTEGTKILAVAVTGRYRQAVSGLPPEVPVVMGGWEGEPGVNPFCGSVYVFGRPDNRDLLADLPRRLYGLELKSRAPVRQGRAVVGQPLDESVKILTSRNLAPGDFKTPSEIPEGEAGLTEALRLGMIKPASWVEFYQWRRAAWEREKKAAGAEGRSLPPRFNPQSGGDRFRSFLVVSPDFVIPNRLSQPGIASFTFFVPPGLERPAGPLSRQTRILFMADGTELSGRPERIKVNFEDGS